MYFVVLRCWREHGPAMNALQDQIVLDHGLKYGVQGLRIDKVYEDTYYIIVRIWDKEDLQVFHSLSTSFIELESFTITLVIKKLRVYNMRT